MVDVLQNILADGVPCNRTPQVPTVRMRLLGVRTSDVEQREMPSASDQWYSLDVTQLIRKTVQGAPAAQDALEKHNKLKRVGGEPLTFFSGVSRFLVLDDNDKANRSSIRRLNNESKPYPG